jgi:conjugative relaxase-like TrwC/TraI family protein
VLSVAKVTQRHASAYAEYLDGRSKPDELGDYYLKDGERVEAPGRWVSGAGAVGADPGLPVRGEQLRELMAVRRPDTGEQLRAVGAGGEAVAAIDATFSAPKSVSAVWALAAPGLREQIEGAHELAVDRALAYATGQVAMVRERVSPTTVIHAKASEVIATSWRHTTARAVHDQPPDPQLHSHILLHAAVRRDGQIVAIDSRAWFVHRRELGAAYRTELASELSALGFEIERGTGRGRRYFEIAGIPPGLIDRWSSRHHQVREAIERRVRHKRRTLDALVAGGGAEGSRASAELDRLLRTRRLAPGEDRYLTSKSRKAKDRLLTHGDLDRHWARTARGLQFESQSVESLRGPGRNVLPAPDRELLERLTEFDATFPDREVRAVALEASAGVSIDQALGSVSRLRSDGALLRLLDATNTTDAHRQAEHHTVSLARTLAAGRVSQIPPEQVQRQIKTVDARLARAGHGRLTAEQQAAIVLGCSDRQLVVIEGQAGSGKSTTLAAIARAHQADERQIVVTSTAALAARRLALELQTAGVSAPAYSTQALHAALTSGRLELSERTAVIHDEAALASTREQQHLFAAVHRAGARLIEIGDAHQSQAVGAAGLWPHLEHAASANAAQVELTHNVRARDPADQRDQRMFREEQPEAALRGYQARGLVKLAAEQSYAEDAALEAAHADRRAGKRALVISQTSNEHLDELNARAQAIRIDDGELGKHGVPVAGRPYELHAGDQVQIRRTINHPHVGRLSNGTIGQVLDVDPTRDLIAVRLADGRDAQLDRDQLDRADLRLAYVQHPFPAQGQTSDTAHLIVTENATQEGSYVALTRGREHTTIHASVELLEPDDDGELLRSLAERMSRTEPEIPSIATPLTHEHFLREEHERDSEWIGLQALSSALDRTDPLVNGIPGIQQAASRSSGFEP